MYNEHELLFPNEHGSGILFRKYSPKKKTSILVVSVVSNSGNL